jgi:AcrR family transcriptional regulator
MLVSMSRRAGSATRIAILDAARSLFEVHGYFAVGLDAVAKKAGVSRQAIYLHYASKAELLRALHERVNEQDIAPVFDKVWEAKTATAALDAWIDASAEAIPRIMAIFNALEAPSRFDPDVGATWQAPAQGHYADCRRLAERLGHEGELARGVTVATAADVIWTMTSVQGYESLVIARGWSRQRWIRWVRQTLSPLLSGTEHGRSAHSS